MYTTPFNAITYHTTSQGPRSYNEDRHCIERVGNDKLVMAVFDGHGGYALAEMCAKKTPLMLQALLETNNDVDVALFKLYDALDKMAMENGFEREGCCAVIVLLTNKRVWFSNCGDSMAVCKTTRGVYNMSEEHKVSNERERLTNLDAYITSPDGCERLFGNLNIARAIGDHCYKKYVISRPYITSINLEHENVDWICLASDGLWDVVDATQYGNDLAFFKKKFKDNTHEILNGVVRYAYVRGSTDNITIIQCDITPLQKPQNT